MTLFYVLGVTNGSILIACTIIVAVGTILGVLVREMPSGSNAIDLAQKNSEEWRGIADSRGEQIKDLHAELGKSREAAAEALRAVATAKGEAAKLAETAATFGTLEPVLEKLVENQTVGMTAMKEMGDTMKEMGQGIHRLLESGGWDGTTDRRTKPGKASL